MKPFSKQTNKWILSTLLFAALGSQYYYSVSSHPEGSIEMSSSSPAFDQFTRLMDDLKTKDVSGPEDQAKVDQRAQAILAEFNKNYAKERQDKDAKASVQSLLEQAVTQIKNLESMEGATADDIKKNRERILNEFGVKVAAAIKRDAPEKPAAPAVAPVKPPVVAAPAAPAVAAATAPKPPAAPAVAPVAAPAAQAPAAPATPERVTPAEDTAAGSREFLLFCSECGNTWVRVSTKENQQTIDTLAKVLDRRAKEGVTAAPAAEKEKPVVLTAAEKKEAEDRKKRDKKEAEEEAKQQKLRDEDDAKVARNEAFEEKMEEYNTKCEQRDNALKCITDRMASLLRSATGKNKIDQSVITRAYNKYIDKDLKAALSSAHGSEARAEGLETLEKLTGNDFKSLRSLKTLAVMTAREAQVQQASKVQDIYNDSARLYREKNFNDSILARQAGDRAKSVFQSESIETYTAIKSGLTESRDQTMLDYVNSNYVPDIRKLYSSIAMPSLTAAATTIPGVTNSNTRGGRNAGGEAATTTNTSGDVMNGVIIGTPGAARTGNRGGKPL